MHRFTVNLPEDTAFEVRKRAAQDGYSLTDVVRRALVAYLAESRWLVVTDAYGVCWAEKGDDTTLSRVRLDHQYVPELVVGGEVGRFLRSMRWSERTQNSLDTHEIVLSRLSLDFAHYTSLQQFTTDGAFDDLKDDLHLELLTRAARRVPAASQVVEDETVRSLGAASALQEVARASRTAIDDEDARARHSAADNLWRETGNLLAQQLLRHESVSTTQGYLHPGRDDLSQALTRLQVVNPDSQS